MTTTTESPAAPPQPHVDPATVPGWPRVLARLSADGAGVIHVDDEEHRLHSPDLAAARSKTVALVRLLVATPLARPVRVDTEEPDGAWQVIVHPDGVVQPAEDAPVPTATRVLPPALPATPTSPRPATMLAVRAADPLAPTDSTRSTKPTGATESTTTTESTDTLASVGMPSVPVTAVPPRLSDLIAQQPPAPPAPATWGWRHRLGQLSGGLMAPGPGPREQAHRAAVTAVQRTFNGARTVVVVNPKGGAHKTTAALMLAATFGLHRGGYTLAWDNNETRGTMGWRAQQAGHQRTVVDLLSALPAIAARGQARVGDIDPFMRPQHWGHFDVLASDEDAASSAAVDAAAFAQLHEQLAAFYRVMVIDTGNNIRASNWQAALAAADQLVIVSTVREDTSKTAAWLADALAETGHEHLVRQAVTVLTAPSRASDVALEQRLHAHFARLTRAVVSVPHDPTLVAGGPIDFARLSPATREAWLRAAAEVAVGL